jgi:hypothetical protein
MAVPQTMLIRYGGVLPILLAMSCGISAASTQVDGEDETKQLCGLTQFHSCLLLLMVPSAEQRYAQQCDWDDNPQDPLRLSADQEFLAQRGSVMH